MLANRVRNVKFMCMNMNIIKKLGGASQWVSKLPVDIFFNSSISVTSFSAKENKDKEGRAEKCHDNSYGQFVGREYNSCESIAQRDKAGTEQGAKRDETPCLG